MWEKVKKEKGRNKEEAVKKLKKQQKEGSLSFFLALKDLKNNFLDGWHQQNNLPSIIPVSSKLAPLQENSFRLKLELTRIRLMRGQRGPGWKILTKELCITEKFVLKLETNYPGAHPLPRRVAFESYFSYGQYATTTRPAHGLKWHTLLTSWSRFLRRPRSDLTRSLSVVKSEFSPAQDVLRTCFWSHRRLVTHTHTHTHTQIHTCIHAYTRRHAHTRTDADTIHTLRPTFMHGPIHRKMHSYTRCEHPQPHTLICDPFIVHTLLYTHTHTHTHTRLYTPSYADARVQGVWGRTTEFMKFPTWGDMYLV